MARKGEEGKIRSKLGVTHLVEKKTRKKGKQSHWVHDASSGDTGRQSKRAQGGGTAARKAEQIIKDRIRKTRKKRKQ